MSSIHYLGTEHPSFFLVLISSLIPCCHGTQFSVWIRLPVYMYHLHDVAADPVLLLAAIPMLWCYSSIQEFHFLEHWKQCPAYVHESELCIFTQFHSVNTIHSDGPFVGVGQEKAAALDLSINYFTSNAGLATIHLQLSCQESDHFSWCS